jgi:hypothetical protein
MDLLTELGTKYNTDKANYHRFTQFYNSYFNQKRYEAKLVMEIGVLNGGSLKMWEEYFPNATIIGVDNQNKKQYEQGRIKIHQADQEYPDSLVEVAKQYGQFDIIIDDGSHLIPHQYQTLGALFPYVKINGYYVLEDLHTSHFPKWREWYNEDVKISMLESIQSLKKWLYTGLTTFKYQYISQQQAEYIENHLNEVDIFDRTGDYDSITSVLQKI